MTAREFENEIKKDLAFMFNNGEAIPDLWEAIKELYTNMLPIDEYYQCQSKTSFVEKYSKLYI
jgi:hypothetical protein